MKQLKGFSLIEVLISLVLVSTVALALLEQQLQIKQLLNQLIVRAETSQFLDAADEYLLVSSKETMTNTSLNSKTKNRTYGQIEWK